MSRLNCLKRIIIILFILSLLISSNVYANTANISRARQLFDLSLQQYRRNNISEAVELINRAISLDNTNYVYHYNLGVFNLKIKNYDDAIDKFLTGLKYQADHQESYYNIGLSYFFKNDYSKAADYFKQAISLNQYDIDAQVNLGLAYKNLNQYDAAVIQYQKALMIDPENTTALVNLAVVYKLRNELQRSMDIFNKVLDLEPDNTEALYNIGLLKGALEKQQSAQALLSGQTVSTDVPQQSSVVNESATNQNVLFHKSAITGKDVSLPLDFLKTELQSAQPVLSVSADLKKPEAAFTASDIKLSVSKELPADASNLTKFKEELLLDIKTELNNFLNEFKKIVSFNQFGASQKNDYASNDFDLLNNNYLQDDFTQSFDFGLSTDYSISNSADFSSTADFDGFFNNNQRSTDNFSYSNDGLINFSLDNFDADLNSANYWTGANSALDNFDDFFSNNKKRQGVQNNFNADFNLFQENNDMQFDGLLNFDNLFNEIQPQTDIDFQTSFNQLPEINFDMESISIEQTPSFSVNQNAINLNNDSEQSLISKGIPADIAKNTVWYRENVSKFIMPEDFMTLPAVTADIYNRFKDKLNF